MSENNKIKNNNNLNQSAPPSVSIPSNLNSSLGTGAPPSINSSDDWIVYEEIEIEKENGMSFSYLNITSELTSFNSPIKENKGNKGQVWEEEEEEVEEEEIIHEKEFILNENYDRSLEELEVEEENKEKEEEKVVEFNEFNENKEKEKEKEEDIRKEEEIINSTIKNQHPSQPSPSKISSSSSSTSPTSENNHQSNNIQVNDSNKDNKDEDNVDNEEENVDNVEEGELNWWQRIHGVGGVGLAAVVVGTASILAYTIARSSQNR